MSSDGGAMDVRLQCGDARFSLRAALILLRDGCVLLARHENHDCFYLPGGGVRLNESSEEAVQRECLEELGHSFRVDRLLFLQERFYVADDTQHHEVTFFYLMQDDGWRLAGGRRTDHPKERLHFVPMADLAGIPLVPDFLRTALQQLPEGIVHIVTRENAG